MRRDESKPSSRAFFFQFSSSPPSVLRAFVRFRLLRLMRRLFCCLITRSIFFSLHKYQPSNVFCCWGRLVPKRRRQKILQKDKSHDGGSSIRRSFASLSQDPNVGFGTGSRDTLSIPIAVPFAVDSSFFPQLLLLLCVAATRAPQGACYLPL